MTCAHGPVLTGEEARKRLGELRCEWDQLCGNESFSSWLVSSGKVLVLAPPDPDCIEKIAQAMSESDRNRGALAYYIRHARALHAAGLCPHGSAR